MDMEVENKLQINNEYLEKFLVRVSEIRREKEKKSVDKADVIKKRLEELINTKIQEQLKLGLDIKEIDIDKILKEFGFKKKDEE